MNLTDLQEIPGYREAQEKEQSRRDLAFVDWPVPLCGLMVNQFTLTHLLVLGNCESPFVDKGEPQPEDVAFFLWVVSSEYEPGNERKRTVFICRIANKVRFLPACLEIVEYLKRAFQDRPVSNAQGSFKVYTSFAATYCDIFAREYGWDDQAVMRKPVARLFQLLRRIESRHNPRAVLFNPESDRVISEYLRNRSN